MVAFKGFHHTEFSTNLDSPNRQMNCSKGEEVPFLNDYFCSLAFQFALTNCGVVRGDCLRQDLKRLYVFGSLQPFATVLFVNYCPN